MKTARTGVFETNSSSMHSVTIDPDNHVCYEDYTRGIELEYPEDDRFCTLRVKCLKSNSVGSCVCRTFMEKLSWLVQCLADSQLCQEGNTTFTEPELHKLKKSVWFRSLESAVTSVLCEYGLVKRDEEAEKFWKKLNGKEGQCPYYYPVKLLISDAFVDLKATDGVRYFSNSIDFDLGHVFEETLAYHSMYDILNNRELEIEVMGG